MLARLGDERLLNSLVKSVGITDHKLLRVNRLLLMADISSPMSASIPADSALAVADVARFTGCTAQARVQHEHQSRAFSEWPVTRSELQRGRCGRFTIRCLLAHVVFVEDVSPGMNRGLERPKRELPPSGLEPATFTEWAIWFGKSCAVTGRKPLRPRR
jgi:hypothetical protein